MRKINYNKINIEDLDNVISDNKIKGIDLIGTSIENNNVTRREKMMRGHKKSNKLPRIREARRLKERARNWLESDERMQYSYPMTEENNGYILNFCG